MSIFNQSSNQIMNQLLMNSNKKGKKRMMLVGSGGTQTTTNGLINNTVYITNSTATNSTLTLTTVPLTGSSLALTTGTAPYIQYYVDDDVTLHRDDTLTIHQGREYKIGLPDGTRINVDKLGNFEILDKDAKVTYKANNNREFNRYVNASDLLEEFIKFAKELNLSKTEFLSLPIELFIKWLILEAAKADGDEPDSQIQQSLLTYGKQQPRCGYCGKWIKRLNANKGLHFCSPDHYQRKFEAIGV